MIAPPGTTVVARDQRWRVARVETFDSCSIFTLEAAGRDRVRVIDPFDRVTVIDTGRIVRRHRRAVLQIAMGAACRERPALGLWTAARATIDLLPYQLEPAMAVLRGATRLLLADAVGLGKTIQAGLILSELRERGLVARALVLCPAGVRHNWADELRQRFGIACAVFDQPSIAEASAALPPGVNPWATQSTVVASIDFVKRPEVIAALADVPIDIVIADEAHHLTPGTERGEAVGALASRTPWCVLVSATPHSGDAAAFDYLSSIGAHGDALSIFRRSRHDAGFTSSRRERVVRLASSVAESELHEAVEAYTRAIWRARAGDDPSVQLVAITIARRAASSPLALQRTLLRRLDLLSEPPSQQPVQAGLPWDEDDDDDGCGAPQLLAKPGFDDAASERAAIRHLLTLTERCQGSAKLRWIARALARLKEPAIVYSEYRDTIEALAAQIPSHIRVATICGSTAIEQRRLAVDAFNSGGVAVLLATDAAGEGLNLHHRCRLVIDVELPWNPLRLEQRIGRVDRIGQRRRVHALRLLHTKTIEERVLERLQLRRQRAEWLDHGAIDERAMAACVLGDAPPDPPPSPTMCSARLDEAQAEHGRLVRSRGQAGCVAELDAAAAVRPRRRRTEVMAAVHLITYVNQLGSIVASHPCAHTVVVDGAKFNTRDQALEAIRTSQRLECALGAHRILTCKAIEDQLAPLRLSIATRIARIRAHLAGTAHRALQPSLFDGRAAAAAARAGSALQALDNALHRTIDGVNAPVRAEDSITRLIAVWPLRRR